MTPEEFEEALKEKFAMREFPVGWCYQREGYQLVAMRPDYGVEFDESDEDYPLPSIQLNSANTFPLEIVSISDITVEPTELYFQARALCEANGEEFVWIEEPGKWHDHVFVNFHDEGLYSLDTIEDDMDWDTSEMSPEERIQEMPFFQNPVAKSLQEFFDMIVEVPNR